MQQFFCVESTSLVKAMSHVSFEDISRNRNGFSFVSGDVDNSNTHRTTAPDWSVLSENLLHEI